MNSIKNIYFNDLHEKRAPEFFLTKLTNKRINQHIRANFKWLLTRLSTEFVNKSFMTDKKKYRTYIDSVYLKKSIPTH